MPSMMVRFLLSSETQKLLYVIVTRHFFSFVPRSLPAATPSRRLSRRHVLHSTLCGCLVCRSVQRRSRGFHLWCRDNAVDLEGHL